MKKEQISLHILHCDYLF